MFQVQRHLHQRQHQVDDEEEDEDDEVEAMLMIRLKKSNMIQLKINSKKMSLKMSKLIKMRKFILEEM
jgi:hypothetical protein